MYKWYTVNSIPQQERIMHKFVAIALAVSVTLPAQVSMASYGVDQRVVHVVAAQAGVSTECLSSIMSISHVEEIGERTFECTDAEWRNLTRNCTEPSPTTLRCAVGKYQVTFSSRGDIVWVKER